MWWSAEVRSETGERRKWKCLLMGHLTVLCGRNDRLALRARYGDGRSSERV